MPTHIPTPEDYTIRDYGTEYIVYKNSTFVHVASSPEDAELIMWLTYQRDLALYALRCIRQGTTHLYLNAIEQEPIPDDRALRMRDVAMHGDFEITLAMESEIDDRWEVE